MCSDDGIETVYRCTFLLPLPVPDVTWVAAIALHVIIRGEETQFFCTEYVIE
jgi:hypothetical protein